jgi:hypothetical protein
LSIGVTTDNRNKSNLRMALILASIALAFFGGFIIKMYLLAQ